MPLEDSNGPITALLYTTGQVDAQPCCSLPTPAVLNRDPWTSSISITGNLLEMQIHRPHARSTALETLGLGPSNLYFNKPSGDSDAS